MLSCCWPPGCLELARLTLWLQRSPASSSPPTQSSTPSHSLAPRLHVMLRMFRGVLTWGCPCPGTRRRSRGCWRPWCRGCDTPPPSRPPTSADTRTPRSCAVEAGGWRHSCLLSPATWRSWARAPWPRSSPCRGRGSSAPGRCRPHTAASARAGTRGGAARGYTRRPCRSGPPPRTATRRTWPRPRHRRPRSPAARHTPAGVSGPE